MSQQELVPNVRECGMLRLSSILVYTFLPVQQVLFDAPELLAKSSVYDPAHMPIVPVLSCLLLVC